ncbi:MAG: AI-2E family transporter [Halobacteriales archaeon]
MEVDRRYVLGAALAAVAAVTIGILRGVLGTIFFAITAVYVLEPLVDRLRERGLPDWWAAAAATATAYAFGLAMFVPLGAVLYVRRRAAIELLRSLPDSVAISLGGFTHVVQSGDVAAFLIRELSDTAIALVRATPILAAKLVVFGFVVFALLYRGDRVRDALLGPVPDGYQGVVAALHDRIRGTLFSLYVIQAATAVATFVAALVVFAALGVRYPVTLAVVAGLLQFLPVVGPSLLVAAIAVADLLAGDVPGAVLLAVVGLVVVAFLPDALLRPRLARETANLPASLYFVGFTGGILSLGAIGIVAGPLAIAILVELLSALSREVHADD